MVDPVTAVQAWLKQDAIVASLVGTNVFAPVLPEGFSCANGGKCIVIRRRGGDRHPEIPPLLRPSVVVEAWSLDSVEARQIHGAASDVIHGANMVNLGSLGFVILAREEVAGQDVIDPVTHWPMTFGYFHIEMRAQNS